MVYIALEAQHLLEISVGVSLREVVEYNWLLVGDVLWLELGKELAQFFLNMHPFVNTNIFYPAYSASVMALRSGRSQIRNALLAAISVM